MKPDYFNTEIANESINLRPIRPDDAEQLYEAVMASFKDLHAWMPWCHDGYSLVDSTEWCNTREQYWNDASDYTFAIIDKGSGTFLGGCGINRIDRPFKTGNLGYWVRTDRTRKNIATQASWLTVQWGFQILKLNRIEIITAIQNTASVRVAENLGAIREGLMRNRLEYNGVLHDAWLFSLLSEDVHRNGKKDL